jgi:hypothetical protein
LDKIVVLLWSQYSLLCLGGVALWQFLHIAVSILVPGFKLYFLRQPLLLLLGLPSIVLGFVLGGWLVGLLNIPIGMLIGTLVARAIVIAKGR